MTGIEHKRGKLKIFMGYAAGVGKTYKMLEEARQMQSAGEDVAIGYFEPHGRRDTIAKTEGLEIVPRKKIEYRGSSFEEMDTCAILARRPRVALVDEFAHTNVPGSKYAKRWEDVDVLLNSGINVFTTMNIQHLESLNDQVWQITGVRVRETVPDWVVENADEVIMVDLTPRALVHRLERGAVYGREKAERARENFFRESTLAALRELALRQTAHEVQHRIWGGTQSEGEASCSPEQAARKHRILVFVTPDPQTAMVVRRARRMSDFLNAECFAVAVTGSAGLAAMPEDEREALEKHLNFARNLHIETRVLEGNDAARTVVDFSRRNRITEVYLAHPQQRHWLGWASRNIVERIVGIAKDLEIVIVSARDPVDHGPE